MRLVWRDETVSESSPPLGLSEQAPEEPGQSSTSVVDGVTSKYPRIELQQAILLGDPDRIRIAADHLLRDGISIPSVYESAIELVQNAAQPGEDRTLDLSAAAVGAAREIASITGPGRFKYGHEMARAKSALATLTALQSALATENWSAAARAWSKLRTCWPGLLSQENNTAGLQAFEFHGGGLSSLNERSQKR